MSEGASGIGKDLFLLLEPWSQLSDERARFLENELARELAPHHTLYGLSCTAVADRGASDDVLFKLKDGRFTQVHLTFTRNPPEGPGWPEYRIFDTVTDWMIEVMIEDHVDNFGLS